MPINGIIIAYRDEKNIKQYQYKGHLSNRLETNKKSFPWHCLNLEADYAFVFQKGYCFMISFILWQKDIDDCYFDRQISIEFYERGIYQDWFQNCELR